LYDSVVELREHRLDEEDVAAEVAKALEALGKDKTMLAKKAMLVDTSLAAINQVGLAGGGGAIHEEKASSLMVGNIALVSLMCHQHNSCARTTPTQ
jgi:hypothetical protein